MLNLQILKSVLVSGAASAALATAALAADAGDGSSAGGDWDIAFGATITSDYIGRGMDLSGGPAFQPWAEFSYGMFYAGYWGSNVVGDWENDLSIGIRPELGPLSIDLGHVWYLYGLPGGNGSEAYIKASVTPVDPITVGGAFYYGTWGSTSGATYAEVNASLDLTHGLSASGAVGWIGGTAAPYTTWNAGLTWNPVDPLELDVRYHWAPSAVGGVSKVVVSASVSSSLRSLGIIK